MTSHRVCLSTLVMVFLLCALAPVAGAQCILANPSFEIGGTGGAVFRGWNQFGLVGSTSNATHGTAAAKVTGPNLGGWDVSGYWQRFDTAPGERWEASVRGWHTGVNQLTGQSKAILNIEWRDTNGNLISFESHTVADASTPIDEVQDFYVQSGPAPGGTVATHFLLGVLQGPTDPQPDVYFDEATFDNLGPPSIDDIQWNDFPGGRTVSFSGRTWRVKGPGIFGPGSNSFCDDAACTWVDGSGWLHMTIQNIDGTWYSTEVTLEEPLGYGDYIFTTRGRLDQLDLNVVFGMFTWQYPPCWDPASHDWWNPYNEIDIEFGRWGTPGNDVGQFVTQPWYWTGNMSRFDATFSDGELTSHAFRWLPDRVEYRSWRGGVLDEAPANMIHSWTYTGPHVPRPEQPRIHVNLWHLEGTPPTTMQEVVLDEFTFVPEGGSTGIPGQKPPVSVSLLSDAWPNPFNPSTTIGYAVVNAGRTELVIYDARGRRIRTLVNEIVPAGSYEVTWDGRNDAGQTVASGVYLYQLRTEDVVETKRMVLLK